MHPDVEAAIVSPDAAEARPLPGLRSRELSRRLADLGRERLAMMDDCGVDVQVLSLSEPGLQTLAPPAAVRLQAIVNDAIAEAVRAHPDRYQGFATLATSDPPRAAEELRRAVTELGLHGAHLFGRTLEKNLDHPDMWPIFEVAADLRAPIYLHPGVPRASVREAYYSGFGEELDQAFATFGIGWHYEAGIQLLRLALGGVFDRFPSLALITGHWGEVVLFYLERVEPLLAQAGRERSLHEYMRANVYVTPSGMFSERYLRWTLEVLGPERIMFSTDYPFRLAGGGAARAFLAQAQLAPEARERIASGNWERLVAAIRR